VLLRRTLESLQDCRRPESLQRILVIENGSDAGARQLCHDLRDTLPVDYYQLPKPGKSRALQWCIDHIVKTGFIVFLDDDIRLSPDLLLHYERARREHAGSHFFGGPTEVDYELPPPEWLKRYFPYSALGWRPTESWATGAELFFLGCNWAADAEDIQRAGGFDSRVGPGGTTGGTGQETAMQIALMRTGVTPVYISEALVWHYVPASRSSMDWTLERAYQTGKSAILLALETPQGRRLNHVPIWMLRLKYLSLLKAISYTLIGKTEQAFAARYNWTALRGRIDGLRLKHPASDSTPHSNQ
jgi:glycosyltransferase involved in cell wall biosynthesis